jgi:hypothetical protein
MARMVKCYSAHAKALGLRRGQGLVETLSPVVACRVPKAGEAVSSGVAVWSRTMRETCIQLVKARDSISYCN